MLLYTLQAAPLRGAGRVRRVSIICFPLVHLAPGDPLTAIMPADAPAGAAGQMEPTASTSRCRSSTCAGCGRCCTGDLGNSIASGRPVLSEVSRRGRQHLRSWPRSQRCSASRSAPSSGFVAGYFAVVSLDRRRLDLAVFGVSVPHYWLGIVLVIIFSVSSAAAADRRGSGRLRQLALDDRAPAPHDPAGDHDVGHSDGHHRPHRACARRRDPHPGIRAGAAGQRPAANGSVFKHVRDERRADRHSPSWDCNSAICSAARS